MYRLTFGARVTWSELDGPHQRGPRAARRVDERRHPPAVRLDDPLQLLLDVPVQVPLVAVTGDEARTGESRERVRDRRPLGAHQPPEQLMGQRQRQPDPARLDPPPARGEMPQQQREPHVEPRLRSDRALHVEVVRAALGAPQQRLISCGHGRTRSANCGVEHREPHRQQRPPVDRAGQQLVVLLLAWLDEIAGTEQLRGDPVADPTLSASTPSSTSTPGPGAASLSRFVSATSPTSASNVNAVAAGRATSRIRTSSASARSTSRSSR